MAYRNTSTIYISNSSTLSKTKKFKHEYHRNSYPAFKFHKTIVRYRSREILLNVLFDEKQLIVLEIMKRTKMKTNQNCHYFTIRKLAETVTAFLTILDF